MRNKLFLLLIPLFAIGTPVLHALNELSVPLLADGAISILSALSMLSLMIGIAVAGLDRPEHKNASIYYALQLSLLSAVILLSMDLSFGGHDIVEQLLPSSASLPEAPKKAVHIVAVAVLFAGLFAMLWLLRKNVAIILFSVFGAVFFSTVALYVSTHVDIWKTADITTVDNSNNQPPVIHIVFDEMIGTEGVDRSVPGGEEIYRLIRDFHERFGFRLFGKTFSRHFISALSIPNLLNFDYTDDTYGIVSKYVTRGNSVFGPIKFFDEMKARDYEVVVYQSKHLNYCEAGNVSRCEIFDSFNPTNKYISQYRQQDITFKVARILTQAFIKSLFSTYVGQPAIDYVQSKTDKAKTVPHADRYDLQGFDLWFNQFAEDVLRADRARLYFAHFVVPHAPHVLDNNCDIHPRWTNPYYLKEIHNLAGDTLLKARSEHYRRYYEQIGCLYKKLTEFMIRVEETDGLKDATFLIHGDHGSRISSGRYLEVLSERDLVDNYSTLFAIRSPGIEPGYDLRLVSIQRLFTEIFSGQQPKTKTGQLATVAIESKEKERVIVTEMPNFGATDYPASSPRRQIEHIE